MRAWGIALLLAFLQPARALESALDAIRVSRQIPSLSYLALTTEGGARSYKLATSGLRRSDDPTTLIAGEDPFHLGSVTKSMTALLVAMAVREGRFNYETPVSVLFGIPGTHEKYSSATLLDLLVHRGGVGDDGWMWKQFSDPSIAKKIIKGKIENTEARSLIAREIFMHAPAYEPRSDQVYSNPSYILLGGLLEKIYGKPVEDLIAEKIFQPLGMSSCGFGPTSIESEKMKPTRPWAHEYLARGKYAPIHGDNPKVYGPAGGAHCNLKDWMKYEELQMDLFKGKSEVLPKEIANQLFVSFGKMKLSPGGWGIEKVSGSGDVRLAYEGSNTLNRALVLIYPKNESIALITTNAGGPDSEEAILDVWDMLRPELEK